MFNKIKHILNERKISKKLALERIVQERGIAKQILIVRKDLNMRKGKIAAQCAHASLGVILSKSEKEYIFSELRSSYIIKNILSYSNDSAMESWIDHSFTKICVYVNSEQELLDLDKQAKEADVPHCLIQDSGKTEFNNIPTYTVLAIGPSWSNAIDKITGKLPLL